MTELSFEDLSSANAHRCSRWHPGFPDPDPTGWSGADWANAMQGEAGEAGNIVKKIRRLDLAYKGRPDEQDRQKLIRDLALELADTVIYLDLLATYYGIDLAAAIIGKFNAVSMMQAFPERLGESSDDTADSGQALESTKLSSSMLFGQRYPPPNPDSP